MHSLSNLRPVAFAVALLGAAPRLEPAAVRWGARGHEMAARTAVALLPERVPDFFRSAGEQLVYLDPEPDRWRVASRREMSAAWSPDHFINLEALPAGALDTPDRYAFLRAVWEGTDGSPGASGFLPFRIVELYQRLVTEWELWRRETDPLRRGWIEERIINDAGLLGHYVTDGSQPLHTTIHYNGWSAGAPNPSGFTEDRTFHARFETDFVNAHVTQAEVRRHTSVPRSVAGSSRAAVMEYLMSTYSSVEQLYRLDRDIRFDPGGPARSETVDFAAERLAAGADMLAVLWLSAWEESA
jgi:hypothetical protein